MEHGQKVEYVVDDPALLTALSALDFSGLRGPAMEALSATKRWLTIGVTASPFFKVRNLIRDSVQAIGTGTWRQLQKEGRSEQVAHYFDANQETISRYRGIERAKRVNSGINNQIRNIERSHLLSPEEKRERINQLRSQSERLAREAA
jgi:hypothetical protein